MLRHAIQTQRPCCIKPTDFQRPWRNQLKPGVRVSDWRSDQYRYPAATGLVSMDPRSTDSPNGPISLPIFPSMSIGFVSFFANAGVIFTTSYTAAEGFANAPLNNNADWVGGPNVAVRPGTTGFVRNGQTSSTLPTYNIHGALGGRPGSTFQIGDQISINTYIQFDLPGPRFAQEIARFGFSGLCRLQRVGTRIRSGLGRWTVR